MSLFFSPFDNKYKGVSGTPPESLYIVSISDRSKITPPEIVHPKSSKKRAMSSLPIAFVDT